MPVDDFRYFPIFDAGGAMPGLHNEFVMSLDVAKHNDFVIGVIGYGHYFAHCRHPAADQTFKALFGRVEN